MTFPSPFYCNNCGAANQNLAEHCSFCDAPLHTLAQEPLLKERYRLLLPVGQGGFGAVYKAEDTLNENRLLAIKETNLSSLTAPEAIEATAAFNREVHLLSNLTHPNLPRIYDHFTDREHWYLVMNFIDGETLEQYLDRTRSGHLLLAEVLNIGIQLCTVFDYLHTREPSIIFRDLKPTNVMRTPAGHLYLIDFGIARHFKPGKHKDTIPLGSPGYAAPEQYGRAQTTPRSDIYSLGALLYQLLTGHNPEQTPFRFELSLPQDQSLPRRLLAFLLQMVEMDVNKRPTSMLIVKQELEQIVAASQPVGTLLANCQHYRLVTTLAWSPDSSYIVSNSANSALHLWNATTGYHLFTHREPFKTNTWASSLAWSPDSKYIAYGSDTKTVQIWQVEKDASIILRPTFTYRGHTNWVNAVAWSPDSTRIASGSDDTTVQIWQIDDTATKAELETYRGHSLWVVALAWSPNGSSIASGSNDTTIHIRNIDRKETTLVYRGHSFGINALSWSPDGMRIASCSWDNIIRVWDTINGCTLLTCRNPFNWINTVAWSPDGRHLASGGQNKTVQIWNVATGQIVFSYHGHSSSVCTVAWSPDGTRIASAGNDGTIQVWQAT